MRVLVADNDSFTRECISSCIDWKRYSFDTVYLAKNGLEALATAQVTPPDLVITEIALPYIDGLELLSRLKEIKPDICTIVVSGAGEDRSMKSAIHLGTFEYILKPVDLNELRDAIYRAKTHIIELRISEGRPNMRIPRDASVETEEEFLGSFQADLDADAFSLCNVSGFVDAVEKGDLELASKRLAEKRWAFLSRDTCSGVVLRMFCSNMFGACENEIKQLGGDISEVFESPVEILHAISSQHYIDSTFKMLERAVLEMLAYIRRLSTYASNSDIEKAKDFIDSNYSALDVSLNGVAKLINMNPAYFSVLFKRSVGMTFINYLTQVRIDKSRELLSKTNMKIYEVAYAVGYDNPTYFSTVFKKISGCSPQDYRKNRKTAK